MDSALTRELARWWAEINASQFEGAMRPPSLLIDDSERRWGSWRRTSRTLSLSERLIDEHPWQVVVEVLRHEMAHQYVDEVLGIHDETAHGPAFRKVCAERAIDGRAVGSPEVTPEVSRIQRRVEGLLALADSENEYEARAAMSMAHRLMRKHNIELGAASSQEDYSFRQLGSVRRRTPAHEQILAGLMGQHFFVQPIWVVAYDRKADARGRVLEICGRPENIEIADHVHTFMLATCERLWSEHKRAQGITSNRDRRRYLQGVMIGFGERLSGEAKAAEETGLVWSGDAGLQTWVGTRYRHLRSGRRTRMTVDETWGAGRADGQQVVWRRPVTKKGRGIRGLLGLK